MKTKNTTAEDALRLLYQQRQQREHDIAAKNPKIKKLVGKYFKFGNWGHKIKEGKDITFIKIIGNYGKDSLIGPSVTVRKNNDNNDIDYTIYSRQFLTHYPLTKIKTNYSYDKNADVKESSKKEFDIQFKLALKQINKLKK